MSAETALIEQYFDAFNRHDLDAVMACFADDAVVMAAHGRRIEGAQAIREYYDSMFNLFNDANCAIQALSGADGKGFVESVFTGVRSDAGYPVRMVGVEVIECQEERIRELRDYHLPA